MTLEEYIEQLRQEHRRVILEGRGVDWREEAPIVDAIMRAEAEEELAANADQVLLDDAESPFGVFDATAATPTQDAVIDVPEPIIAASFATPTENTPTPSPLTSDTPAIPPLPPRVEVGSRTSTQPQVKLSSPSPATKRVPPKASDIVSPIPRPIEPSVTPVAQRGDSQVVPEVPRLEVSPQPEPIGDIVSPVEFSQPEDLGFELAERPTQTQAAPQPLRPTERPAVPPEQAVTTFQSPTQQSAPESTPEPFTQPSEPETLESLFAQPSVLASNVFVPEPVAQQTTSPSIPSIPRFDSAATADVPIITAQPAPPQFTQQDQAAVTQQATPQDTQQDAPRPRSIPRQSPQIVQPISAAPRPTPPPQVTPPQSPVSSIVDVLGSEPVQQSAPQQAASPQPQPQRQPGSAPVVSLIQQLSSGPASTFDARQTPPPDANAANFGAPDVAFAADMLASASEATTLSLLNAIERITTALLNLNSRLTSVEEVLERSFGS